MTLLKPLRANLGNGRWKQKAEKSAREVLKRFWNSAHVGFQHIKVLFCRVNTVNVRG